ncbi:LLM class flavin-dependent oxidoreductase (plasmid) [Rhodococcus globerulus]|uniref:LLM class flavin-dependent oxidoreductase n=1 Tax=Rhodococcus globerulus TaxID=33008 RepID=UPI0039EA6B47
MSGADLLHLAVALDGAGWHPAAWRHVSSRPDELLTAQYWVDIVRESEAGLLDFVTIEDSNNLQSSSLTDLELRTDRVRGRLDAMLLACRIAPHTAKIGIVPTTVTTDTEPFHISKAIATLDYISIGRAGWRATISNSPGDAALYGRRLQSGTADGAKPPVYTCIEKLFDEATDSVEVVRRLWDSWEDGAIIRDASTGRFLEKEKVHHIDFESEWFSVRGPSITPRPPQGQPVVTVVSNSAVSYGFAAQSADVVHVTPHDLADANRIVAEVRHAENLHFRSGANLKILADLVVFLDDTESRAASCKQYLDSLDDTASQSDTAVFTGTASQLADLLLDWQSAGLHGFQLLPGVVTHDLPAITRELVPELQRRGVFRDAYEATTLRGHLGLERPPSRYSDSSA